MISIPHHPFRGFQRPLYLFTKEDGQSNDDVISIPDQQESKRLCEAERMEYEQELFPKTTSKTNMSEISPQSGDQYEQLENEYAPTTLYYDTPSHNIEHQNQDTESLCYDIIMRVIKETEAADTKTHDNDKKLEDTGGEIRNKIDKALEENEEMKDVIGDGNVACNPDKQKEYSINKTGNDDKEVTEMEKTIDDTCEKQDDNQKIMGDEIIDAKNC